MRVTAYTDFNYYSTLRALKRLPRRLDSSRSCPPRCAPATVPSPRPLSMRFPLPRFTLLSPPPLASSGLPRLPSTPSARCHRIWCRTAWPPASLSPTWPTGWPPTLSSRLFRAPSLLRLEKKGNFHGVLELGWLSLSFLYYYSLVFFHHTWEP